MAGIESYLRVDICDVSSLPGVVAFIDGVGAVEVLADDFIDEHIFGCSRGTASGLLALDAQGSWLALDLVHLAQGIALGPEG